ERRMTEDARMREFLDRAEIQALGARYAQAVDDRDWETVAACFTAGAHTDFSPPRGPGAGDPVLAHSAKLLGEHYTMHFLGAQTVTFEGDTARSTTYAVTYVPTKVDDKPVLMATGLRYLDELVRTDSGWRICRRKARYEWSARAEGLPA